MIIKFPNTALLIIDVQNDFCPGGVMEITGGDGIIPTLNRLAFVFAERQGRVVATQDWHPSGHSSFSIWPEHCVQGSQGADFYEELDLRPVNLILRKGFRKELDSYSAFFENDRRTSTGLDAYLKTHSINTVVLGGLATDYCVLYSAMDAVSLGYNTIVVNDAVRGLDSPPGSVDEAIRAMREAGVNITESGDLL